VTQFGERLRTLRQAAKLSQNELARRAGINPGTINRFEANEREPTGREQVVALAQALELDQFGQDQLLAHQTASHRLPYGINDDIL
jgi:transcriptional regulator with XRE-family HTH domain